MSFKRGKGKKSTSASSVRNPQCASSSPPAATMPEEAKAKLQELFSQIEHQFELMHTDNAACEFCRLLSYRSVMHAVCGEPGVAMAAEL